MELIIILIITIILYSYIGYPFLLMFINKMDRASNEITEYSPHITLFVSVHNESQIIEQKIRNCLELSYPRHKLEIMIADDGSKDDTYNICDKYRDKIKIYHHKENKGKNRTINIYTKFAQGEIIVFTDANTMLEKDAIGVISNHFCDQTVGCVSGNLVYTSNNTNIAEGESLYYKYENFIKKLESETGNVVSASGALYAVRKKLITDVNDDVPNDFQHPIQVHKKGHKVLFEKKAVAMEPASQGLSEEFNRRVRIVAQSLTIFFREYKFTLFSRKAFFFISHKLLRWLIPFFLIALFILCLLSGGIAINLLLILQVIFYLSAGIGLIFQRKGKKIKLFYVPFYFCAINCAALKGVINWLFGKSYVTWEVAKGTRQI